MSTALPEKFKSYIEELKGERFANSLFQALDSEPAVSIRINPLKNKSSLSGTPIKWCSNGILLPKRPAFIEDPLLHAGAYYVQESSSMFLEQMIGEIGAENITYAADLCAAPGGKSTHAASLLQANAVLLSNEVSRTRANILAENITKWGLANHVVTNTSVDALAKALPGQFDLLIIDAPCSGEGMFRKDMFAREQWSHQLVSQCANTQRDILQTADNLLKQSGHIIYSTCTFNLEENEAQVQSFCENFGYEVVDVSGYISKHEIESSEMTKVSAARFWPGVTPGEGLYMCLLRKMGKSSKPKKVKPMRFKEVKAPFPLKVKDRLYEIDSEIFYLNEAVEELVVRLVHHKIPRLLQGLQVAEIKGKSIIPSQQLANSILLDIDAVQSEELSTADSLKFLKKESIDNTNLTGYVLFTHEGLGLGWGKALPNRINNMYPKHWRILKDIDFTEY